MKGLWRHFLITLQLNYKSWRSLTYGYLMPILFLVGFASVFRSGNPRLTQHMGQVLTITILGSTCLGMATALVSERERGLWRRYQLLPVPTNRLLSSVMAVRVIIVFLAVALQMLLAKICYGTPFPHHIIAFLCIFPVVMFAFLGIGLIITALARDVPSVQALGQCIFLPMILIGGVGIPLVSLPQWAKIAASFMPGRYAVELLQACYQSTPLHWESLVFATLAMLGIGTGAMIAGQKLMRWDPFHRISKTSVSWLLFALFAWFVVGLTAVSLDRVESALPFQGAAFSEITEAQIDTITFEPLPEDYGFYAPLAPPLNGARLTYRMQEFQPRLGSWKPGQMEDVAQAVLNLLCVAAIADIQQDPSEPQIARMVFDRMQQQIEPNTLRKALASIILDPEIGHVITTAPELGLSVEVDPDIARERCNWYARKFLGRLLGKIPENS